MKKTFDPLVSVLIPTYNGEKHILETIESVKNQSYQNIEIIVVDDKSTDDTLSIVKKIEGIFLIENENNKGLNLSVNDALEYCNGKYLILFGHDDVMIKNRIEKQVNFMEKKSCLASFGNSYYMYGESKSKDLLISSKFKSLFFNNIRNTFLLFMMNMQFNSNSMIILTDVAKKVGGFETWYRNYGESYLYFKIALLGQIMYQDEVLSYYRKHDNNMTYNELQSGIKALETKKKIFEMFFKKYQFKNFLFYYLLNKISMFLRSVF